ncbi:MAG: UDP-N-acetylglucosamine 2-epimerase (non-hydrolyzing) [Candidatus Bathyarchaeia archaeon]
MTIRLMAVIGARPQFIKSAPVIAELSRRKRFELMIIHSGQHYDPDMSSIFFRELSIPKPIANLQSGSGSHAEQTATIMKRLEQQIIRRRPDLILVPGDTNTTLAGALTAAKLGIPVAHLEAGLRSGDLTMPEEINRILTDHCSSLLFAPTRTATRNLAREGLSDVTHLTGDTMVDALKAVLPTVKKREDAVLEKFGLERDDYLLVTLHRPVNVDDPERLRQIRVALQKVAKRLRIVFPVHPRTRSRLSELAPQPRATSERLTYSRPQGYIETLALLKNASALLTDSGGMQKESFLLHVPCITLRSTTEWPETLVRNANRLVTKPHTLPNAVHSAVRHKGLLDRLGNPFGNGHASARIATIMEKESVKMKGNLKQNRS